MAEVDLGSHLDDLEEQEPIKVSVTFKPQEQESDEKHDNADHAYDKDKPSPGHLQTKEDKCNDSEAEEPSLPANPPVTPIPSYLDTDKVDSDGHKTEQQEVLEGWKGYSNNIYIQPIIVNHASCGENQCPASNDTRRRLTSQDIRKQMRLREANNLITKHNERIQSTGTLRSKADTQEKRREQAAKQIQNKIEDNDNTKYKQKKLKIHKGFVCRTWATNFLPNDAQKNEDDEFIPFYVRKYVGRSKSAWSGKEKQTSVAEENISTSEVILIQKDPHNKLTENGPEDLSEIEVQMKKKTSNDELNNKRNSEKHITTGADNVQNLSNVVHELTCSCGRAIPHDNDKRFPRGFKGAKTLRSERTRNSKVRFSVALPIKQFPPINPLEELKKTNIPVKQRQGVSLTRRPHTVDTALLSKGVILVNGHYNLPNFAAANRAFGRQCRGQTASTSSPKRFDKERQICSKVKDEQGKRFDECIELSPWGSTKTLNRNGTPQCVLNDGQNGREISGRCRFSSDPRRAPKILDENRNNLYRNSAECLTGNRRRIRTPTHSLNSEDDDSNTESNDTGLGSEIEYSVDGLAKLDVYLQPRNAILHNN